MGTRIARQSYKKNAMSFLVTAENFLTMRRIDCSFPRLMPKIAMVAYFASCGAAWAVDLPTTADGWKVIGLSPAAEVFWIRPSLIRGLAMDRRVPVAIATPSKGVELSTAHIDCGELVFYRVLQDGRRTAPVKIANGSTWKSIATALCTANQVDSLTSRSDHRERSLIETASIGLKRYGSDISSNPWMSNAAAFICIKLAAGASLEAAGGEMAFRYSKELSKLYGVSPNDSMRTIDEVRINEMARPIVYIAMAKCPGPFSSAPLR
jgi:hypothetical protein